MEFLYRLNALPRSQTLPSGEIHITAGDPLLQNMLKKFGTWSASSSEEFSVIVPVQNKYVAERLLEAQKSKALAFLTSRREDIPLPATEVSLHLLDNGEMCVLGKPSAKAMIEMQQMGGMFSEDIILNGDTLMGWSFKKSAVNQLQELLTVSPSPYIPAAAGKIKSEPQGESPIGGHHTKPKRKGAPVVAQVTPVSSTEKPRKKANTSATKQDEDSS